MVATVIIGIMVAAIVAGIITSMIRNKRKAQKTGSVCTACSCGCSGCYKSCSCMK